MTEVVLLNGRRIDVPLVKAQRLVRKGRAIMATTLRPPERATLPTPIRHVPHGDGGAAA